MANTNAPRGFTPLRRHDGAPLNAQLVPYLIPAADGTAVGIGDVVELTGTSAAAGVKVGGMDCEGMATVVQLATGTTGQNIVGVVMGFSPDPDALAPNYRRASTNRIAYVMPVEGVVFEVQSDEGGAAYGVADAGLNAAILLTAASTTTGRSQMEVDISTKNTTATLPVSILGISKRVDNALNTAGADTDNVKLEVLFNTSAFKSNRTAA